MKQKILILMSLGIGAMLISAPSFAGRETGNGGYAYVCRTKNGKGKIKSAKLLDLWEAENLSTWNKNNRAYFQTETVLNKIKDISPNAGHRIEALVKEFKENSVYTNRPLSKTEDAFPPYRPEKGCDYEQVARYEKILTETGKRGLRINREIFESPHFSETDRSALFLHEAVYYLDRLQNEAETSTRTRTVIAHLYSNSEIPNAVRVTLAMLLPRVTQCTHDMTLDVNIFAVKDPALIPFTVHFGSVDGVQSYSGKVSEAQKANLYRCQAGDDLSFIEGEKGLADSGWMPLEDLLDLNKPDVGSSEVPFFTVSGTYSAVEFTPTWPAIESQMGPNSSITHGIEFECSVKTPDGSIQRVPFEASYQFEDSSACPSMSSDGSLNVRRGEDCLIFVRSLPNLSELSKEDQLRGHSLCLPRESVLG